MLGVDHAEVGGSGINSNIAQIVLSKLMCRNVSLPARLLLGTVALEEHCLCGDGGVDH